MIAQLDKWFVKISLKKTYSRLIGYFLYEGRPLTTKGRWINPLLFKLYSLQKFVGLPKVVKSPIFILGTGRSGTTILGVTLGIHKDVGFLNEPKAVWASFFEGEDLIGSYNDVPARYELKEEDVTDKVVSKAHKIFGNFLRLSFSSRLVDKYPELIFRVPFARKIFPDAKMLFLHRNGIDTLVSIDNWSKRKQVEQNGETHDWWGKNDRKWKLLCDQIVAKDLALGKKVSEIYAIDDHSVRAAVEWVVTMKKGMELIDQYPDFIRAVSYEEYVSSAAYRDEILDFCDLNTDKNYSDYCDKVLGSPPPRQYDNLPGFIQKEFDIVMTALGYKSSKVTDS